MDSITKDIGDVNDRRLPKSAKEARDILDSIRVDRGFLGPEHEEELSHLKIGTRDAVHRLAETARHKTAKYTNSVAGELYSSKTRFIYELLQNADDSDYGDGRGEPRVTIILYPDRIFIETNETGFTIANVRAICDTGESSKKGSAEDKSIGEKGYGFKSVFGVAYQARIRSGYWSFYFEHHEGDDGLGMITPIDMVPEPLPVAINTQIELRLLEDGGDLFQRLSQELKNLHETTIFFLQKIETLIIHVHSNNGPEKSTQIKKQLVSGKKPILDRIVSLTRRDCNKGASATENTKFYHVREQDVLNMPIDKHRKGVFCSKLKLAFPFDPTTRCPIVSVDGQYVFAYLPLYRESNLPVTSSPQTVVSVLDSAWNQHLRANIATAFCDSVRLFYVDNVLRYQWLKYLPVLVASRFEGPLYSLIKTHLLHAPVFEAWQSRSPARQSQLRIVPTTFMHGNAPLFRDLDAEIYLAPEYSHADYDVLRQIGIRDMAQHELLDRLVHDLGSPSSRFRSNPIDHHWHDTCSSVLVSILSSPINDNIVQIIRRQQIIPLRYSGGDVNASIGVADWVSAFESASKPVHFAATRFTKSKNITAYHDTLAIPRGLPIRIVHEESSLSVQRVALFVKLGVIPCADITVVNAILKCHLRWDNSREQLSVQTLVSHLHYLFWFREIRTPITQPIIVASGERATLPLVGPVRRPFYIKSDGPYDAWSLFQDLPEMERDNMVPFISDDYMGAELDSARSYDQSWMQWLEEDVRVRRRPPLLDISPIGTRLSPFMLCVLKYRPGDFIPTLQAHWTSEYRDEVANSSIRRDILSQTEVQCQRTSPTKLSRTYIPTPALQKEAERIGISEHIPFLRLPALVTGEAPERWQFLSAFGVGAEVDLDFYLDLLSYVQKLDHLGPSRLFEIASKIYTTIGSLCNRERAVSVKKKITEARGIYVPSNVRGQRWRQPQECLWDSPCCISIKSNLINHYGNDMNISTLFRTHLQVQDTHVNDYLDQLRYIKRKNMDAHDKSPCHGPCALIYQELLEHQKNVDQTTRMRQVIESEKLVFAGSDWHSPSQCLWSNDTSISEQISIAGIYVNFEKFFVGELHVKKLSISMLISDLKRKATAKTALKAADAKALILKINIMLSNELLDRKLRDKFDELKSVKLFPIRGKDGHITLADASADFSIVDNRRFGEAFSSEADVLDFSLDEVHIHRPFLEATGVTEHYLSKSVKEISDIEGNPTQSLEPTHRLQAVAYALFCCAVHFKSSKIIGQDKSLYERLLSVSVHEADKMGTSLILEQHGRIIKVPSTRTQLKTDTGTTPWKIYVPKDAKARRSCYSSQLPQDILELLGISGNNATLAVNRLINERHDQESESLVLEQFDVLPISWVTRSPAADSCTPTLENIHARSSPQHFGDTESLGHVGGSTPALSNPNNDPITPRGFTSLGSTSAGNGTSPFSSTSGSSSSTLFGGFSTFGNSPIPSAFSDGSTSSRSTSTTPLPLFSFGSAGPPRVAPSPFGRTGLFEESSVFGPSISALGETAPTTGPRAQGENYRRLLDNIIKRVSGDRGVWDLNNLAEALPGTVNIPTLFDKDEVFGVRNEDHLAHDIKIGAAGEVFAFEKLLAAGLLGFSRDNWLSTIRHQAKAHERYKDMPDASPDLPAGTREPADIVYADPDGNFAKYLETQDCVGLDHWLKTAPVANRKYFIEVKTTTRTCNTTFYMSNAQHKRMFEMRKKQAIADPEDVYVVCRVYNLLSNDIQMCFYVSPGRSEDATSTPVAPFGDYTPGPPILKFSSKGYEVRPVK